MIDIEIGENCMEKIKKEDVE